jgi:PKD repeat protein
MSRRPVVLVGLGLVLLLGLLSGCFSPNVSPLAVFTRSPSAGSAPLSVFFDASESRDPDGTITKYAWDFGDGATAKGVSATHTYGSSGTFAAELTVTDDRGASGTATKMVTVSDGGVISVGTKVGEKAPDFTLQSLDEQTVSLSQFRGFVVLLDFWASSCGPCRSTLPYLETLRARYAGEGLVLVSVSVDENVEDVRSFLEEGGYSQIVALWQSHEAAEAVRQRYGVTDIPRTFVIDRQGIIRWVGHPIVLRDRDIEPWL